MRIQRGTKELPTWMSGKEHLCWERVQPIQRLSGESVPRSRRPGPQREKSVGMTLGM